MPRPPDLYDLLTWVRAEAERVKNAHAAVGAFAPGIEFLRRYAGPDSDFYRATGPILDAAKYTGSAAAQNARIALASLLLSWADYADAGFAMALPFEVAARVEAAGDLMEQTATLMRDKDLHPAAAVMLAGAALEECLRGLFLSTTQAIGGKPSITTYGEALRKADVLDAADVKEILALASVRNEAAHGHFENITRERATIFADRVNLFMRQNGPR